MKTTITITIIILLIQIVFVSHLLKANLYLKHEVNKVQIVEKKVLAYTECPVCPPCRSMADIQAQ